MPGCQVAVRWVVCGNLEKEARTKRWSCQKPGASTFFPGFVLSPALLRFHPLGFLPTIEEAFADQPTINSLRWGMSSKIATCYDETVEKDIDEHGQDGTRLYSIQVAA